MNKKTVAAYLLFTCFCGGGTVTAGSLDDLYGFLDSPSHVKYYEVDDTDRVMLNPYLQVATDTHKGRLDPSKQVYAWVIDGMGNVRLVETVPHPRGRTYSGYFKRPEDGYDRESGYVERYGHISALGGRAGRIGGEIVNDQQNKQWIINNKSGRYSRKKIDRTPEQLSYAAARIKVMVDPGGQKWGPVVYLLDYAPLSVRQMELVNPCLKYVKPENKTHPYLLLKPVRIK